MDWADQERRYDEAQRQMADHHLWFEDWQNYGLAPALHKNIALGRAPFYVQFVDFFFETYGRRLYLLDFMLRLADVDGQRSLLYYIEDADEIHVNLEGVFPSELAWAAVGIGHRALEKRDLRVPYTTTWEINQLVFGGRLERTWFRTGSAMTRAQAFRALGGQVPRGRILDDNRNLLRQWRSDQDSEAATVEVLEPAEDEWVPAPSGGTAV